MKARRLFVLLSLVLTFATANGQSAHLDIASGVMLTKFTQTSSNFDEGFHLTGLINARKKNYSFKIGLQYLSQNTRALDTLSPSNTLTRYNLTAINVPVLMGIIHETNNFKIGCHAGVNLGNVFSFSRISSAPGRSSDLTNRIPLRQLFGLTPISLEIGRVFDFGDIYFHYAANIQVHRTNPYTQGRFFSHSLGVGLSLKINKDNEETQKAPAEP